MMDLQALGFTKKELQERVVNQLCQQMLETHLYDGYEDDGVTISPKSAKFSTALTGLIQRRIDQAVSKIAAQYIEPSVEEFVRNFTIQKTNEYGEKRGEPITFTEYLVKIAHDYLREPVNYKGLSEAECRARGDSWYRNEKSHTRVVHMLDEHMQYYIKTAMESAVNTANAAIAEGIQEAVKIKLAEVIARLKVDVKTK